jgi:hypothetical protein
MKSLFEREGHKAVVEMVENALKGVSKKHWGLLHNTGTLELRNDKGNWLRIQVNALNSLRVEGSTIFFHFVWETKERRFEIA